MKGFWFLLHKIWSMSFAYTEKNVRTASPKGPSGVVVPHFRWDQYGLRLGQRLEEFNSYLKVGPSSKLFNMELSAKSAYQLFQTIGL